MLTPQQRSESARNAVQARWSKSKAGSDATTQSPPVVVTPSDSSDEALLDLLKRLKTTSDLGEIRRLSDQIERVVFHKQSDHA
jgi:hypothetical protein